MSDEIFNSLVSGMDFSEDVDKALYESIVKDVRDIVPNIKSIGGHAVINHDRTQFSAGVAPFTNPKTKVSIYKICIHDQDFTFALCNLITRTIRISDEESITQADIECMVVATKVALLWGQRDTSRDFMEAIQRIAYRRSLTLPPDFQECRDLLALTSMDSLVKVRKVQEALLEKAEVW